MAETRQQTRPAASPLGIPWPLWILFVTYLASGIIVFEKVHKLELEYGVHKTQVGHRGMERKMSRIEAQVEHLEREVELLKSLRWQNNGANNKLASPYD